MSLKQLSIASYGKELYKQTSLLQKYEDKESGCKEPDDISTAIHLSLYHTKIISIKGTC